MITVISAGTSGYREMMAENRRRCEALGYRYVAHDLELSSDLQGALPPCTFKPELLLKSLRDGEPRGRNAEVGSTGDDPSRIIAWLDADAIVVRPLGCLIDIEFDVAVTLRPPEEIGTTQPTSNYLNAGVIFFRPGGAACQFVADWCVLTAKTKNDQAALNQMVGPGWTDGEWRNSFDCTYATNHALIHVLRATEWNWSSWDRPRPPEARILHFKHGWRAINGEQWWRKEIE